jgi:DNA primase
MSVMSVTDEIKSRIDIVNYVQRYVPSLKKAGRNYKACCPFHNEKSPSFIVNPLNQTWRCFGACAEGGDLFTFAQKMNGWDFKEALRELGQQAGVEVRKQTPEQKSHNDHLDRLRGILATAADFYHEYLFHDEARDVLAYTEDERGFTRETIDTFKIGYAPDSWQDMLHALTELGYSEDELIEVGLVIRSEKGRVYDRFRNRLIIPIRDERGRVVGFGGRILNPEDNPKYLNSPQTPVFDKSRILFGLDTGKKEIRNTETVVIVEGYMDAIQAYQAGYHNVVAQMGTSMTETQVKLVAPRYAKKIVLALDADEAGQNATRRSLEVARQTLAKDFAGKLEVDMRVLQIPSGKDPDDFLRESPDEWQALVDNAQPVADFVIDVETANLASNASLQERQAIANRVLPILMTSENNLYKQDNIQKLAMRLRINERDLLAWAKDQWQIESAPSPRQSAPQPPSPLPDDMPPPMDFPDNMPPEYWGDDEYDIMPPEFMDGQDVPIQTGQSQPVIASPQSPAFVKQDRAMEGYCLSLLMKNPNLLYQANRKLRELAGSNDRLLEGPLCELGIDDFSQSQYRILMVYFQESISQDEMEPLDYVRATIGEELIPDFNALFKEDTENILGRIHHRHTGDLHDIVKSMTKFGRLNVDIQEELINKALKLRQDRLQQERIEMQYLQQEAQASGNTDPQHHNSLNEKIMLSMTAKARIDTAVS